MQAFSPSLLPWFAVLFASVAFDAGATAYLKVASDRLSGGGFLGAALLGALAFTPSILAFAYAIRIGPSYIATVGIWAVGVYAANALVGIAAFGDAFSWRTVLGMAAACLTIALLKPT